MDIATAKHHRGVLKGQLTKALTYVRAIDKDNTSVENLRNRRALVDGYFEKFEQYQSRIEILVQDDAELALQITERDEIEGRYIDIVSILDGIINEKQNQHHPAPPPPQPTPARPVSTKLPEIPLPTFDGKYEDWPAFEDLFKATIDSKGIPACEKLQYLKSCLKGDAGMVVKAFTTTDDNYAEAWKMVRERYHNNREIVFSIIEKLLNQHQAKQDSVSSLQTLLNTSLECIQSLKVLGRPTDEWSDLLIVIIMRKLDPDTRSEWAKSFDGTDVPTFKDLQQFIGKHIRTLYARGAVTKSSNKSSGNSSRFISTHHTSTSYPQCKYCKESNHPLYFCEKFKDQEPRDRKAIVMRIGACLNCLHDGHKIEACNSKSSCRKCNKNHNTMIHINQNSSRKESSSSKERGGSSSSNTAMDSSSAKPEVKDCRTAQVVNCNTQVLLKTAVVDVLDAFGRKQACRVFFDEGSEGSFISEACANGLGLEKKSCNVIVKGISGSNQVSSKWKVSARLYSQTQPDSIDVDAYVIQRVTEPLPRSSVHSINLWSHISELKLADPYFAEPGDVDILLGGDVVGGILREGLRHGPVNTPVAQNSIFGWVLFGKVCSSEQHQIHTLHLNLTLDDIVRRFWEIEEVSTQQQSPYTNEEKSCENYFKSSHHRKSDGRYVVSLPFNDKITQLGDTRKQAHQRFLHLERKFKKYPKHHAEYIQFINEYEQLGHMQAVNTSMQTTNQPIAYLPHHFVIKEDSSTTKLRVVFDGSAKSSTGVSLNDCLMVGPTVQGDLYSLLLRFRIHPIALKADIAKMYRQFEVRPEDTDCQRILWRDHPTDEIKEFRLSTVTYGTSCAPYLATRCLKQLAEDEKAKFPAASRTVDKDMYVDDLMSGETTPSKAILLVKELIGICEAAGMSIRKWCSNDKAVMQSIPEDIRETGSSLGFDTDDTVKALGVRWQPASDNFHFQLNVQQTSTCITKRKLLSDIARVYDPLGWLTPVTIIAKIILQQLWTEKVDWDDVVPNHLQVQWNNYLTQLSYVEELRIPRCVVLPNPILFQLHGFCDSSEKAYATAIYLRCVNADGTSVQLLTSKSKVAPLRQTSLPRLELCGALMLAEHLDIVRSSLNIQCDVWAWTDSSIVLRWISCSSRRWKTYVANRISQVQALLPADHWRHVRSEDNPADLPTKGMTPSELATSSLWWHGPSWLQNDTFPMTAINTDMTKVETELRPTPILAMSTRASVDYTFNFDYFSSWRKLYISTAVWIRFFTYLKTKNCNKEPFTTTELTEAKYKLIRWVQQCEYAKDIKNIKTSQCVSESSALKQTAPFIDEQGLLRVGGRLHHSHLSINEKHPIILPQKHHLTNLIIMHFHLTHLHGGLTLTMTSLRRQYWIPHGRDTIRLLIRKCIICRKFRAATTTQLMGSLPESRVIPSRPFSVTGVDFAGPFLTTLKQGRGIKADKCYICIFVCFSTKAVHLEAVTDLSTEAFIATYRRFASRRGISHELHSDCGTNFVGASRELHRLLKQESRQVQQELSGIGTMWKFNPPSAPHHGGLWESGVKSVKFHFYRVVGDTRLTIIQFMTLLCNIEACLNSRPLCALSSDPLDMDALTPGHFLIGAPLTSVPDPDITHIRVNRLGHWQQVQQLSQHFWKRWVSEYLTSLQQRYKWYKKCENLSVGDLVVLKDDQLPPTRWKLGRVTEIHPGSDGLFRFVKVKTASGELKRPITKLSPLILGNEA